MTRPAYSESVCAAAHVQPGDVVVAPDGLPCTVSEVIALDADTIVIIGEQQGYPVRFTAAPADGVRAVSRV